MGFRGMRRLVDGVNGSGPDDAGGLRYFPTADVQHGLSGGFRIS